MDTAVRLGDRMSWKLHREVVLLLGWGRAILFQIAHPLVAQGVADHSGFLAETRGRWRRLHRTLGAMLALTFGSEEDGARIARRINAIHDRVNGRLARACGVFPEGAPYTAKDPRLLAWVHATLLDSFLLTYELYVGPLRPEERDRYCAEASEIEPMLEIPAGALPRSTRELDRYLEAMLASGEIAVSETARLLAREIVTPPVPFPARPFLGLARLPTVGLLPPAIREAYGFGWDPRRATALRLSGTLVRRLLPLTPSLLRHWPAARAALRRQRAEARVS